MYYDNVATFTRSSAGRSLVKQVRIIIVMIITKRFENVSCHMIMLPLSLGWSAGVVKQVRIARTHSLFHLPASVPHSSSWLN